MYYEGLSLNILEFIFCTFLDLIEFLFVLSAIFDCFFKLLDCFTTCRYLDLPLVDFSTGFVDILNHIIHDVRFIGLCKTQYCIQIISWHHLKQPHVSNVTLAR